MGLDGSAVMDSKMQGRKEEVGRLSCFSRGSIIVFFRLLFEIKIEIEIKFEMKRREKRKFTKGFV